MDKKERKKLVKELTLKVQSRKELNENMGNSVYRRKIEFNKKYLSTEEEFMLEAFKDFLRLNPELTRDEVREVLSANKKMFRFLIECEAKYLDFYESVTNSLGLLKHRIAEDKKFDEVMSRKLP